jgi:hypothetical protein
VAKRRLFQRLQKFIFVWPGDENLQTGFNGEVMIVPPRDTVAEQTPGSPYRFPAAEDRDGRKLPGTIVIQDRIVQASPSGGHLKLFDAAECCAFMEDSRDDLFNRGFAIVMDPDDVGMAMEEGRPKYEASQMNLAREILHAELERRKRWDAKGIPAPPSSSDHKVRWAVAHLETAAEQTPQLSQEALVAALAGKKLPDLPIPAELPPAPKPVPRVKEPLSVTELFQMADAAGVSMTKAEMAKLLRGDPDFRESLLDQIATKQEGERATA